MPSENSSNMWVFREGRSTVRGQSVLKGVRLALQASGCGRSQDVLIDALLRAGEMECALADAGSGHAMRAAEITDAAAAVLIKLPGSTAALERAAARLDEITPPESVSTSPPEGFAYYALHPLDYATLAAGVPLREVQAAVVGIRSIGTTLSAVVQASLMRRGIHAERITVRPVGHPYDRRTTLSTDQLRWIARRRAALANFLVVDEGPGISGSSFLSVGDALLEAGVERERITLLCSRDPNVDTLAARDGAARWRSFRSMVVPPTGQVPADCGAYLGGGEWRRLWYREESHWPASWTQMERLKFLSRDGRRMFKFHGLGRFGDAVAERARLLGDAGFGPRLVGHTSGFSEFEMMAGHSMGAAQISAAVLERVADYCALRSFEFSVRSAQGQQLENMVRFNMAEEFGHEPGSSLTALSSDRLVIADGRMLPHEWLATGAGALVKTDGATHGDDHLFPGPVDIAWDLAGAVVEWGMTAEAARYMLDRYRQRSGDEVSKRIKVYQLAYTVFRMAYCAMAAFSMRGSAEESRLRRAATHYRKMVEAQLKAPGVRLQASGERNLEWRQGSGGMESALAVGDGGTNSG
jgi:hypothetical protein